MHRIAPFIAVCMLLFSPQSTAQIFKWADGQGNLHFSDHPPPGGAVKVQVDAPEPSGPGGLTKAEKQQLRRIQRQEQQRLQAREQSVREQERAEKQRRQRRRECNRARTHLADYKDERRRGCEPATCIRIDDRIDYYSRRVDAYCR
jgi:hypothetical protein